MTNTSSVLRLAALGFALLAPAAYAQSCSSPPVGSGGAWFRQYQQWCSQCGGTPSANASPATCKPGPNWGGSGGTAYTPREQAALALAQAGSQLLANALREMIFGNPQQDAQRRAAREAQQQWEAQQREQQAREDEERYRRLSASLLDFTPTPELSLLGSESGGGLQLMTGDAAEGGGSGLLARAQQAARWATLADAASNPEEGFLLAEAAFNSVLGEKISLPDPPPNVQGRPVGPLLGDFEALLADYRKQAAARPAVDEGVMSAEHRAELARQAEQHLRKQRQAATDAEAKRQLDEALAEARQLREQAEAEVRRQAEQFEQQEQRAARASQSLRAQIAQLSAAPAGSTQSYVNLGYQDAALCYSQNSGSRCTAAGAPDYQNCLDSYKLGYRAGESVRNAMLATATARGQRDRAAGRTGFVDNDPRSAGPCRYDYVMAYNRGYFGKR